MQYNFIPAYCVQRRATLETADKNGEMIVGYLIVAYLFVSIVHVYTPLLPHRLDKSF